MVRKAALTAAVLALAVAVPPAHAQEASDGPRFQISVSPILALAEWYTGELEYAFSDQISGVVGFGYFSPEDQYTTVDFKARFYPNATPLEGFSLSGIVGYTSITENVTDETGSAMTLGVDLGWSWLFGQPKRWFLGIGLGAKRYFGDDTIAGEEITIFLPTARLNFGLAF
jgi:hypothetical protein